MNYNNFGTGYSANSAKDYDNLINNSCFRGSYDSGENYHCDFANCAGNSACIRNNYS